MSSQALLIFTKNAEKGKVKTRLAVSVGIDEAFSVNQKLVEHTIDITKDLPFDKFIFYSAYIPQNNLHVNLESEVQHGTNLGERMSQAFAVIFEKGYEKAVIIGTDCPELNAELLVNSFDQLDDSDIVIGPAADGGYYLLGMKSHIPELFIDIPWSTKEVFSETISVFKRNELTYSLLPVLHDVDEEKDLIYMQSLIN